jgi:hypothetical protein
VNPQPGIPGNDGKGNPLTLDVYNNTMRGFLRLTVDQKSILCEFLGVDETTGKASSMDAFTVDLTKHVVAAKGPAQASKTRAGDTIRPKASNDSKAKKR